jgi:hypothetical protein
MPFESKMKTWIVTGEVRGTDPILIWWRGYDVDGDETLHAMSAAFTQQMPSGFLQKEMFFDVEIPYEDADKPPIQWQTFSNFREIPYADKSIEWLREKLYE